MLVKLCLIAVSLPLLGFLRSAIDSKKPGYLLNAQTIVKNWHSENSWAARFSPFFAVFIFLFNFIAWGIYGLSSIIEFIAFLVKKIWWLVMWIWNEVLHPTVFALIRYLWHYLVVFCWKFFHFACTLIPEALRKEKMLFAFKKLLFFGGISALAGLAVLLSNNLIVLVIAALIVFYLFQYTVFVTISNFRSDGFPQSGIFPGIKLSVLWLAMSSVSTAILVALTGFSDVYIISGISVMLVQVLLPFAVLFGLAFAATTFYLPAYISEAGEDVDMLRFLKTLLLRFPKLVASQPYQYIGLFVLSIIPFIVLLMLNAGIKQVSGKDIPSWGEHVLAMNYHIPAVVENNKTTKLLEDDMAVFTFKRDSVEDVYSRYIGASRNELAEAVSLKNNIKDNEIHTFERNAYVGENQSFSMPVIPGCAEYEWIISNVANDREIRRVSASTLQQPGSPVLYHKWTAPGKYNVRIRTKAPCNDGVDKSIQVEVVRLPEDMSSGELPPNRYFVSREAAGYAIDMLNNQLNEFQSEKKSALKEFDKELQLLTERVNHLKFSTREQINMLISKILGYLGLVLLLVLYLSAIWTYLVTYHYDMFGFEQSGQHYWVRMLDEIKAKNPNQPLLGIFVLILLVALVAATQFSDFIYRYF